MIALNFRTKLLLAMMLLVIGVTATTLLVSENQVRTSYERQFQRSFKFTFDSFLQMRETRLTPVQERLAVTARQPRLVAPMDNMVGQTNADQEEVDDLYQNGKDQLRDIIIGSHEQGLAAEPVVFLLFLNRQGKVLYPSDKVKLPFSLPDFRPIQAQLEAVSQAISNTALQQVGYLAPQTAPGVMSLCEVIFTPVIDPVNQRWLGVLALGIPLLDHANARAHTPMTGDGTGLLSGIWLDRQFHSDALPTATRAQLARAINTALGIAPPAQWEFTTPLPEGMYHVFCRALNVGDAFPRAYQVGLFSLSEADKEKQELRNKILLSGGVALLAALVLGFLLSHGLVVPLHELARGTADIESGHYDAKVPVRSRDEVGRLAGAFNQMADHIRATHAALEQRIAERTHELAERKKAEAALRQSESSLREAQRIARLGNWEWNVATDLFQGSEEINRIIGLAETGRHLSFDSFLQRVHAADRDLVRQTVSACLNNGQPLNLEHRLLRPDGEVRLVQERAEVLREPGGQVLRLVGTMQDITEQKKIEAQFLRAQRMDTIGRLSSGIAHDLNNILSPVMMAPALLRMEIISPRAAKIIDTLEHSAVRGTNIVKQLLTFARGTDGRRAPMAVDTLIKEMAKIVQETFPKSITLELRLAPGLWLAMADPTQVHQVLLNLCVNARDAMPQGGQLSISAENLQVKEPLAGLGLETQPGPYVRLQVADTGTGMPPEIVGKIFEPFFTTKGPDKGTGLGLATVLGIVKSHQGYLKVNSQVGAGTQFLVYLPAITGNQADTADTSAGQLPKGQGELVLVADDESHILEVTRTTLESWGYRVETARDGAELLALLALHQDEVRAVITDMMMPRMDGPASLHALRRVNTRVKVIIASGTDLKLSPAEIAALNIHAFLEKPLAAADLLITLDRVLKAN